jgi:hypothetical protein
MVRQGDRFPVPPDDWKDPAAAVRYVDAAVRAEEDQRESVPLDRRDMPDQVKQIRR